MSMLVLSLLFMWPWISQIVTRDKVYRALKHSAWFIADTKNKEVVIISHRTIRFPYKETKT